MRSLLLALLSWVLAAEAGAQPSLARFAYTHPQMGTAFHLIFYCEDSALAQRAAKAAFDRLDTLNARLSDYLKDSELNRLCARAGDGRFHPVSADLWQVAALAQRLSRLSRGAFDITAGPYTQRWRKAIRAGVMPAEEELWQLQSTVGYRFLRLDERSRSMCLKRPGMQLDLGAIAKGYAADELLRVLAGYGIHRALADAGGDLALGEAPPGSPGWAIEVPAATADSPRRVLHLAHCGIATSGDTYKYLDHRGIRYSHILDPRTGSGMTDRRIVTVVAPCGAEADALATTCSVLSVQESARLLARLARQRSSQKRPPYALRIEFQADAVPQIHTWPTRLSPFLP